HREALGYPPFGSMIRIVVRGEREAATKAFSEEIARRLNAAAQGGSAAVRVLGPAPAPMAKLRGNFRYQIQMHSADGSLLRAVVLRATADLKDPDGVAWIVDVDPLDMM